MTDTTPPPKPLGSKAYGSIPHLPGSRRGPGDHGIHEGQARICLERTRDKHDWIEVTEKLDGSCVSVARIDGTIVPLIRAGYPAVTSKYEQHRLFAEWVFGCVERFDFLPDGHRVVDEWLAQAHGTRYRMTCDSVPFVAFDVMVGARRLGVMDAAAMIKGYLKMPAVLHAGPESCSIDRAIELLGAYGRHGADDPVEGAVWRVERKGVFDFIAKYVRPDKADGCYLPELSGELSIWNWHPRYCTWDGGGGRGR